MRGSFAGRAALGVAVFVAASAAQAGTISGTATYDGKVPALKPLSVAAEPICAKQHDSVPNEMLVLGAGNTMANVLVRVVSGLPAGKAYPAPTTPVTMDQHGCQYKPHVMGIMVGQPFKVLNSDGILHNVHTTSTANPSFNQAQPKFKKTIQAKIEKPEMPIKVQCDAHGWMHAWWVSEDHPYYAVTDANGAFKLADVPAGDYELEAWHETLGKQTQKVKVQPKQDTKVSLEMTKK